MYLEARRAATIPIGTFMKNIDLQPREAVKTPPRITPAAKAAEDTAEKTLSARLRAGPSAKETTIRDKPVADAIAAPTPCTALEAIRMSSEGDNPPASEDNAKMMSPMLKSLRRP